MTEEKEELLFQRLLWLVCLQKKMLLFSKRFMVLFKQNNNDMNIINKQLVLSLQRNFTALYGIKRIANLLVG